MNQLQSDLQNVFRIVFDDDDLVITDATLAVELNGWDSVAHINLISAIEERFGVEFAAVEIAALRRTGQNVGAMVQLLATKTGRDGAAA
jgi:acyl carrier protein